MKTFCEKHQEHLVARGSGKYLKCKSCNAEYQAKWFKEHKEQQRVRTRRTLEKSRLRNMNYAWEYKKSHPCECGESDPIVLDFDHDEQNNKEYNVTALIAKGAPLERLKSEIVKCVVRCANCHRRRTAKQLGWYSYFTFVELPVAVVEG